MAAGITGEEFDHLKARVDVVEREKTVARHILEQTRRNGDNLAAVKSRLDRHDQRFDILERQMDGLRKDLPKIVGDVMRDVLQERDNKR
jgi:Tfp pilus assembly protein PilO